MRHPAYSVRYSVLSIKSSLLIITLHSSVITTLVYNDTKSPVMTYNQFLLYIDGPSDISFE
jgi:hypothetical protein